MKVVVGVGLGVGGKVEGREGEVRKKIEFFDFVFLSKETKKLRVFRKRTTKTCAAPSGSTRMF